MEGNPYLKNQTQRPKAQWSFNESGDPALCGRLHDLKYHLTIQEEISE
jgi:hypothetical protein